MPGTRIGTLGHDAAAEVDERGAVSAGPITLDWWIGADDRWHIPAEEPTTHQYRPGAAPVLETVVRIPGGEAMQRVYGATAGSAAVAVIEIENRSPAPFTAAIAIGVTGRGVIDLDGATVRIDGEPVVALAKPPGAWAATAAGGSPGSAREIVVGGAARRDAVEAVPAPADLVLLFPVAHRTSLRVALAGAPVDVRNLPGSDAVARGWEQQLERGMRVDLPAGMGADVDAARADLLLADRDDPGVVAALEDWGFDAEAADGWARLGLIARRRARRRATIADPWRVAAGVDRRADPARFLACVRAVLLRERAAGVDILPGFPVDWLGQSVTVDAIPLHGGVCSFAVRWHGARPALLWDAPAGTDLRAPVLDPGWSSTAADGEALLAEPPAALLPLGAPDRSAGDVVPAPGQFS